MKKKDGGYRIKTALEFKTDKETKGKRHFTAGVIIIIGIIMIACVCTLLLLREYDYNIDNIIGRSPRTTESTSEAVTEMNLEGKTTFLLAVSSDNSEKLHHVALVSADVKSGDIKIYTVDVKKEYETENGKGSLSSLFSNSDGSMLRLKEAVSDITGVKISRYIRATDTSFKGLVKMFGGVVYNVGERVRYSCDGVGYIIEKGNQTLTADMSYKYMYYLSQQNADKPDEMSNFLAALLRGALTEQNAAKADSFYSRLRNILDTDISAFDFSNNKSALMQAVTKFSGRDAEIVTSPDDL